MNANELRLNNLFRQKGSNFVETATFETFELLSSGAIVIEGVPINKKILLSYGFKYSDFYGTYTNGSDYCIVYRFAKGGENAGWYVQNYKESDAWCLSVNNKPLQYLHQLQNLYLDLTGNELLKR